jgi:hypothetical protein
MGQSRSGATSNSNFLAALHSGLEQAHEARGEALDGVVSTSNSWAYCGAWIAGDRDFLLGGAQLEVRGPIPKLLCYLAAKSLRATKVEPIQTYSGDR